MTIIEEDLWTAASRDVVAEDAERRLAVARVRVAEVWPFLSGAGSDKEFLARLALVGDRMTEAAEGDPQISRQLVAGLAADFRQVVASRPAPKPDDAALARQLQAALDPEEERAARRQLWTAIPTPAPNDPHAGREASEFASWYAAQHFPQAERPEDLPDPRQAYAEFIRRRHEPAMGARHARALRDRLSHRKVAGGDEVPPSEPETDGQEAEGEPAPEQPPAQPPALSVGAPRMAANIKHVDCDACGATKMPMDMEKSAASLRCMACGAGVDRLHQTEDIHNHSGQKWANCRKCVAGKTPDLTDCQYCDGIGRLDRLTAMIKQADGWDQGLVSFRREGAVQFDPQAFGSERYQKVVPPPTPPWIVDQWGPGGNVPPVGGTPNPLANPANGRELDDTRRWNPQRKPGWSARSAGQRQANQYTDPEQNPYLTRGPGQPATDVSPAQALPGPQDAPSGAAQPVVQDPEQERPQPVDAPGMRRQMSRRPAYAGARTTVVDRLAARVLAANPGLDPRQARQVARDTVRRFTAVGG